MQTSKLLTGIVIALWLYSCSGNTTSPQTAADSTLRQSINAKATQTDNASTQTGNTISQQINTDSAPQMLLDTNKMKADLDAVTNLMNGNADTNKLKKAAADILTTDANVLSDSGISKMYGNSNDPSVNAAKNTLIKMRNSMGITPDKLDSMKKSAAALVNASSKNN